MVSCCISPLKLLLVVFTASISLLSAVAGTPVIAQRYPISQWSDPYRCPDLQLNRTYKCIVTDRKIYLFSTVTGSVAADAHILLGEIALKNAFSLDAYQIEWWTSPNFTAEVYFVAGDESRLIFNTKRRVGYGVSNETAALVSYNTTSHELDTIALPPQLPEDALPIRGISVNVQELKITYYVGAQGEGAYDGSPVELLAYNYSDASAVLKPVLANRWDTVNYIKAGQKGILVMLGGIDAINEQPLSMDRVYVYDIAADKGYLQPTTGTVPSPRMWSCAVVVSAADKSSHQIHVYGGNRPEDREYEPIVDNYYILSLPQFIWTRAPSVPQPMPIPRCALLGSHRMVITAGLPYPTIDCTTLLKILDLNTGATINTFTDNASYTVPHYVVADIGGGGSGGATVTQPAKGYVDGLETLISTPPTEPTTCDTDTRHRCRRRHTGAIIGGAVGGGVAALGLVGLWLWRRRARSDSGGVQETIEPLVHELPDPVPELQCREDGMQTSAHELPDPVPELQSREDGMQTSAHELPGHM